MPEEFEENSQDKTEEPSLRRIEEFRKRGEVASSKELASVFVLAASVTIFSIALVYFLSNMQDFIEWLYSTDIKKFYSKEFVHIFFNKLFSTLGKGLLPALIFILFAGVLSYVVQVGFLWAPNVLKFDLNRINPINGVKKLFSVRALVETIKALLKFILILTIVSWFISENIGAYRGFLHTDFIQSFVFGKFLIVKLSFMIIGALFLVSIGDFAYQKFSYKKRLMMTKEEAKKELKETEGNPEVKRRIKSLQQKIAQRKMKEDVIAADVVITNPTHISVAIRYDSKEMTSPMLVAKGADHLAMRIREIAKENDVPMIENVPLARTIYRTLKIGEFIPSNLYLVVAEVLSFAYRVRKKIKLSEYR